LPGFVERSKTIASLPSLGLLTLAGMTPARHEIRYMEVADLSDMTSLPEGLDLVALSSFSAQIGEAYELATRFREAGVPTVIGGPHVTALPDEALRYCDAVVIGEGEPSWLAVLEDAEAGRLRPRYGAINSDYSLADAPTPAFELLDISKYNRITVQTSRGCPHHCDFCASSPVLTNRYKQKPVSKVLAEIDRVRSIWPRPFLELADDNSFINRAYWKELLPQMRNRRLRWFAETDISVAEDDALLEAIREAGCAQVLIGLESPVAAGLPGIELHNDWKYKRLGRYRDAIRNVQSHGITVNGCFVLGLDGQTAEIFDAVRDFVREAELYEVQITVLTPFPGTPLYTRLAREGRLLEPTNWKKCTLFDINFQPSHMSVTELRDGFRRLGVDLYSEEFTNWRRRAFKERLRLRNRKESRVA
jgi:radical SAM superfamily enzyme YgiQ (UPF0313 family)